MLRRGFPLLAGIGMLLGAAAVPKIDMAQDSVLRMLIFHAPPLLLEGMATAVEQPRAHSRCELHVEQQRTFEKVEAHDPPAGHLLRVGPYVDEQMRVVEPADVFLDQFQIEGPADPGADVRQDFVQGQ